MGAIATEQAERGGLLSRTAGTATPTAAAVQVPEDAELIRIAARLSRDLHAPSAAIYWTDLLLSAAVGYGALALALTQSHIGLVAAAVVVAILALYRAGSFIHELTHVKHSALPGFRLGWNALVGVPLLLPSFLYEGVHNLHHNKQRYGTIEDPEYLPLALMKPWSVPLFVLVAALGPLGQLLRFGLLAPLSLAVPPLRRVVVERFSGLQINPAFRRRPESGDAARRWQAQEIAASLWAISLLTLVASGIIPLAAFAIILIVMSGTLVLNQVRTLVAHLWENDGGEMTIAGQYLDSVNVPPPSTLPYLWAPIGLRYHALHHLLPSVPYHALGEAHRRLAAAMPAGSTFHRADHAGLGGLLTRLVASTLQR